MLGPLLPLAMLGIPVVAAAGVVLVGVCGLMFARARPAVVAAPVEPQPQPQPLPLPQPQPQPLVLPKLRIPRELPDLTLEALGRTHRLAAGTDAPEAREAVTVTVKPLRAKTMRETLDAFEIEPTHAWTGPKRSAGRRRRLASLG